MRLIHTADWHLNDRLGRIDRTADLRERVERVASLCDEHAADVLLVAGDLFAETATADQVAESLRHLQATFAAFFERGGTIVAIAGNHDQDPRVRRELEVARAGMLVAARPPALGDRLAPGRFYLFTSTFVCRLGDPRGGFDVQFALLPYPSPSAYLGAASEFAAADGQNRLLQERVAEWLRSLRTRKGFDPALRTVLTAHMNVEGADIGRGLFHVHEREAVTLPARDLPSEFDYIALGHVHKSQALRGVRHVRYAGSLDRLDFGERDEPKGVVLVEIGPGGRVGNPTVLAIEPTRLIELVITDPGTTVDALRARVPDTLQALVKVVVASGAAVEARDAIDRAVRAAFPRLAIVQWDAAPGCDAPADRVVEPRADFRATVRDYLGRRIAADDPQRDELLGLADAYLDPEFPP